MANSSLTLVANDHILGCFIASFGKHNLKEEHCDKPVFSSHPGSQNLFWDLQMGSTMLRDLSPTISLGFPTCDFIGSTERLSWKKKAHKMELDLYALNYTLILININKYKQHTHVVLFQCLILHEVVFEIFSWIWVLLKKWGEYVEKKGRKPETSDSVWLVMQARA